MTSLSKRNADLPAAIPVDGELVVDPLTVGDYEAIKSSLRKYRDILLCKVLRGTGLRISEALGLTKTHLGQDGPDGYVLVRRSKKAKRLWEKVFLPPELFVELRDFVQGNGIGSGEAVFDVKRRQVVNIFHKAGELAIGRPVNPHEFRGLYVKSLIDGGLPVETVAKMVGHVDVKTTLRYYYDLTAPERAEINRRIRV